MVQMLVLVMQRLIEELSLRLHKIFLVHIKISMKVNIMQKELNLQLVNHLLEVRKTFQQVNSLVLELLLLLVRTFL